MKGKIFMSNEIDLTGRTFGYWTVLKKSNKKTKNRSTYWYCRCICGTEKDVNGSNLRNGTSTNCGCQRKGKIKDLTGQKFGLLTALEPTEEKKNSYTIWKCLCDCGNITYVRSNSLTTGNTKSCGCLHRKVMRDILIPDLTGKKFHYLTVIKMAGLNSNGKQLWECLCDCGNKTLVSTTSLITGNTQSCGCKKSKGETKIAELLKQYNISFTQQQTFPSCKFPKTQALARFDFFINNKYLIEYDGIQHFSYSSSPTSWNDKENFLETQERDAIKNQWCKENGIPLIRIPYTHLEELCIEDLLLETSNFIIK